MTIPKIVWMLWLQGFENAPPLVQTCVKSWERNNPSWSIRLITEDNVRDHLVPEFCDELLAMEVPFKKLANIIRLALIERHGGVWADADCFCTRPLDSWIHDAARFGFFAFRFIESDAWLLDDKIPYHQRWLARNNDRVMANWFLAGAPANQITTIFLSAHFALLKSAVNATRAWSRSPRKRLINTLRRNAYTGSMMGSIGFIARVGGYPFFIFHYHFANLLRTDAAFRNAWTQIEKLSARDALAYSKTLGLPVDADFKRAVRGGGSPVFKFHSRHSSPLKEDVQTQFEWLQSYFD